ncbi:MAG: S4 domain-containing protein [Steroidobacteraceae bacterium]
MARASEAERLQKVLSRLGVASRREAEQWIRAGRLSINGRAASLGDKVSHGDQLRLDGRLIRQSQGANTKPVLLCHRSPGIALLPKADGSESVAGRLPKRKGQRFMSISPLPQVDGGLELLCADGDMAARLQRAVRSQAMDYSLRVRGELSDEQQQSIHAGLLDRGSALKILSIGEGGGAGSNRWYQIDTLGASGNDLRQLLERQAVTVSRLMRIRVGSLKLERSLARGRWRELTAEEIEGLLNPVAPAEIPAAAPGN